MSMFYLRAFTLLSYESDRSFSVEIGTSAFVTRRVDASTVADLVSHMNGYEAEAKASGLPLSLYCVQADRDRKPRGFEAATERGGALVRFVNTDKLGDELARPAAPSLAQVASRSQAHTRPAVDQAGLADTPLFGTRTLL